MNGVRLPLAVVLYACSAGHPKARFLDVGPGHTYSAPSEAAAAVRDGDTVTIAPGTYYDCAVWQANGLTIAGTGPDAVITDQACMGKAAFVVTGDNATISGLTFARVRVMDGNGAGIRAEGRDLTVTNSRFVNNQIGILAGRRGGSLHISSCDFDGNGATPDGQPAHAVSAGALDLLRIEGSSFRNARGGDHIASVAGRTELLDNRLTDEGGHMSGALIWVAGGALVFERNTVNLTVGAAGRPGAVLVAGAASSIAVRANTLHAPDATVPLVRNWTGVTATEDANTIPGNQPAVSESNAYYHRFRSSMAALRTQARDMAALAWHLTKALAHH